MNTFFQIIGSLASLLSIPLAIYLYLKSKENKFGDIKNEIVKILSYQIGDDRKLTKFEILTTRNSKLRENKIKEDSISLNEIIEDLVLEVISSPLIDKENKGKVIDNLKSIYEEKNNSNDEIFDNIKYYQIDKKNNKKNPISRTELVRNINNMTNDYKVYSRKGRYDSDISSTYILIAGALTSLIGFTSTLQGKSFSLINTISNSPYGLLLPFYLSIISGVISVLILKIYLKGSIYNTDRYKNKIQERFKKK